MKCVICKHGEVSPARITVTLQKEGMTLVVKSVPARVCATCGEEYLDEDITVQLLQQAAEAAQAGIQIQIREYVAA